MTLRRWAWYNDEGGRGTMMKVGRARRGMWEGNTRKVGVVQ